ncbi:S49 family peptidase [Roseimaritima ulvae]|uniref:Signal peptide peptidase SppA n=1 Tax=Roseimaritima ulvae TaxID=980254 RepID=A0A5B9QNA4_9BACT|nr:S49 family peptidase [Roseimaritima ulvae]QEG40444.1 Putative signal peptide peptidase SppA [Roseimaritima ulvae]
MSSNTKTNELNQNTELGHLMAAPLLVDGPLFARWFRSRMSAQHAAVPMSPDQIREAIEIADRPKYQLAGGTAVIKIMGPIEYRMSEWSWWYGGTSCQAIGAAVQAAIDAEEVSKIVLQVDSPGGVYPGVPELAKQIYDQRGAKPIVAVIDPYAASAAIWVATAASRVVSIGSGMAGSIGAYTQVVSWSELLKKEGYDARVIRSPEWKAEGHPFESLTDEYVAYRQDYINAIAAEFTAAVAKHRGVRPNVAAEKFGGGRMMPAAEARKAGLIDRIGNLASELSAGSGKRRSSARTEHIRVAAVTRPFRRRPY